MNSYHSMLGLLLPTPVIVSKLRLKCNCLSPMDSDADVVDFEVIFAFCRPSKVFPNLRQLFLRFGAQIFRISE